MLQPKKTGPVVEGFRFTLGLTNLPHLPLLCQIQFSHIDASQTQPANTTSKLLFSSHPAEGPGKRGEEGQRYTDQNLKDLHPQET